MSVDEPATKKSRVRRVFEIILQFVQLSIPRLQVSFLKACQKNIQRVP